MAAKIGPMPAKLIPPLRLTAIYTAIATKNICVILLDIDAAE